MPSNNSNINSKNVLSSSFIFHLILDWICDNFPQNLDHKPKKKLKLKPKENAQMWTCVLSALLFLMCIPVYWKGRGQKHSLFTTWYWFSHLVLIFSLMNMQQHSYMLTKKTRNSICLKSQILLKIQHIKKFKNWGDHIWNHFDWLFGEAC